MSTKINKMVVALVAVGAMGCAQASTLKVIEIFPGVNVEFVKIKGGEFEQGSAEPRFTSGRNDETLKKMKVSKDFWLAKTETTQKVWQAVMKENASKVKGDELPVDSVDYQDVQDFLSKLNHGKGEFNLPTEVQWEYACKAGEGESANGVDDNASWHRGNAGNKSHPVGQKAANAWGLHDMKGNLLEWTRTPVPEALSDELRIYQKGGQFSGRIIHSRCSDRQSVKKEGRNFWVGFRLAYYE